MIILLHGDHITASREELMKLKSSAKDKEVRYLDGKSLDEETLKLSLEASSLFGNETLVIIENLFSKLGKKLKRIETLATLVDAAKTDVMLWEDKEVGATVLKNLKHADVRLYKLPRLLFQFLDDITPGNAQKLVGLYQTLVTTEAAELVFYMIVTRVRQLIQLADGAVPEGLAGWQVSRLTRQAKMFTIDKLLAMYRMLLEMEFSTKNGSSPFTLGQLTEQFLIHL